MAQLESLAVQGYFESRADVLQLNDVGVASVHEDDVGLGSLVAQVERTLEAQLDVWMLHSQLQREFVLDIGLGMKDLTARRQRPHRLMDRAGMQEPFHAAHVSNCRARSLKAAQDRV